LALAASPVTRPMPLISMRCERRAPSSRIDADAYISSGVIPRAKG
jgi:hypothetical protein